MRNCIGLFTNSAMAILGKRAGFVSKEKEHANKSFTFTRCMIHREVLAAYRMLPELDIQVTLKRYYNK